MMRTIRLAVACVAVLVATAGQLQAGFISGSGDPLSAIPGGTQVDFNTASLGSFPSYSDSGVTLSGVGGNIRLQNTFSGNYNTSGSYIDNEHGFTAGFSFAFDNLVDAVAFNFGATDQNWTLSAFDQGANLIESHTLLPILGSNAGEFYGIQASGIATVSLSSGGDWVFLDNLTFSEQSVSPVAVPEPSSLALFGIGACVAGLGAARRREKQQDATA